MENLILTGALSAFQEAVSAFEYAKQESRETSAEFKLFRSSNPTDDLSSGRGLYLKTELANLRAFQDQCQRHVISLLDLIQVKERSKRPREEEQVEEPLQTQSKKIKFAEELPREVDDDDDIVSVLLDQRCEEGAASENVTPILEEAAEENGSEEEEVADDIPNIEETTPDIEKTTQEQINDQIMQELQDQVQQDLQAQEEGDQILEDDQEREEAQDDVIFLQEEVRKEDQEDVLFLQEVPSSELVPLAQETHESEVEDEEEYQDPEYEVVEDSDAAVAEESDAAVEESDAAVEEESDAVAEEESDAVAEMEVTIDQTEDSEYAEIEVEKVPIEAAAKEEMVEEEEEEFDLIEPEPLGQYESLPPADANDVPAAEKTEMSTEVTLSESENEENEEVEEATEDEVEEIPSSNPFFLHTAPEVEKETEVETVPVKPSPKKSILKSSQSKTPSAVPKSKKENIYASVPASKPKSFKPSSVQEVVHSQPASTVAQAKPKRGLRNSRSFQPLSEITVQKVRNSIGLSNSLPLKPVADKLAFDSSSDSSASSDSSSSSDSDSNAKEGVVRCAKTLKKKKRRKSMLLRLADDVKPKTRV